MVGGFCGAMTDLANHPFLRTQLVYDAAPEIASISPYTRVLWDRQHRWISADITRFKPAEKVRLLDVGCGPGHMAESQAGQIELYLGVDPSMIELRRGQQTPGRHFVHGIGEELDFLPDNSFDVVTLVSVLDHCIDWHRAIGHCARALRSGGMMLVAMENSEQLPSRIRHKLGREVEHHDHIHFICLPDVAAALGDQFSVITSRTFGYGFGLHTLTNRIRLPRAIFDALVPALDWIGGLAMPNSGQVLYACYRKKPDDEAANSEAFFRCPSCHAPMVWGAACCGECRTATPLSDGICDLL